MGQFYLNLSFVMLATVLGSCLRDSETDHSARMLCVQSSFQLPEFEKTGFIRFAPFNEFKVSKQGCILKEELFCNQAFTLTSNTKSVG